jgi:multiple sugar transport system substrate-binding protein
LRTDDLVDGEAAADVVEKLGRDTFQQRALELTSAEGKQIAVPSDGFAQLLFYRKDLFKAAGLAEPTTYAEVQKAAEELNKDKTAGIVAGTAPADSFTQQAFEQVALANGCQLVNDAGQITLNSPECQESFAYYTELIKKTSVKGNQDADTTRATYFAGDAAMVIWSSFLLDELAGLRKDALPTCDQCKTDPAWLAENTGIVTTLQGPSAPGPAAYGEIVSWNVLRDASPKAKDLVTYMMSDGYLDWLAISPEGKVPTRMGTAENPKEYADGWSKLETGVDKKALLSDVYSAGTLKAIAESPNSFQRWGLPQNQGELAGAVAGQFVVPQALAGMINSGTSAADATAKAQKAAEQIQTDLGG